MSSSLPEGVTARPAAEADAAAAAAVHYDAESALRGRSLWDAGDVLGWWCLVEPPTDTWLLHEDGELVAVGTLILHGGAGQLGGAVRPDHVGRGLGGALLALAEERSRTAGADALRVDVCAEDEAAVALLAKRGHRDVRAFKAALDESFAEEWGWAPIEFEEWKRLRLEAPDFDPKLLFVVRDGDKLQVMSQRSESGPLGADGAWVARFCSRRSPSSAGVARASFGSASTPAIRPEPRGCTSRSA